MAVSVLTNIQNTGMTNAGGATGSITVPAGNNRIIISAVLQLSNDASIADNGLGLGGTSHATSQIGTRQLNANSGGGFIANCDIFTHTESQIIAAGGSTTESTTLPLRLSGQTPGGDRRVLTVVLEGVAQTSFVEDTGSEPSPGAFQQAPAFDLETVEDGYVAAFALWDGVSGAATTWGGDLTERVDLEFGSNSWVVSAADTLTDGTDVTVQATTSTATARTIVGAISVRPATVDLSGTLTLQLPTLSGSIEQVNDIAGTLVLQVPSLSGTIEQTNDLTGVLSSRLPELDASIDVAELGITSTLTAPLAEASGNIGQVNNVEGALSTPLATLTGNLFQGIDVDGALVTPLASISASVSQVNDIKASLSTPLASIESTIDTPFERPRSKDGAAGGKVLRGKLPVSDELDLETIIPLVTAVLARRVTWP